ncbi:aaa-atpase [Nicotiana attenuata]|uniref:Aaa-atpase n=1 Tax=Nicotiana attenuata TaxID=49451 RepID=A0A314L6L2_NICAT|nr:aaa-atpase [Nicotiana attenuata]
MTNQLLPKNLQHKILSKVGFLMGNLSSQITLIIEENTGFTPNQVFEASNIYLGSIVYPSVQRVKISKAEKEKKFSVTISKDEKIIDTFEGVELIWELKIVETQKANCDDGYFSSEKVEQKWFELSFLKNHKEMVLDIYLPFVVEKSKAIKEENKVITLSPLGSYGTGKSSLIAAIANYLKFDIYDMELSSLRSNSDFRRLLVSTTNRSILVIEDIDCTIELENRDGGAHQSESQVTLSGLLNFIDGLWSSCGDERIIVFTTNFKERLDPALLRPGRMDMHHIHMSYCTPTGFKILASNYLGLKNHSKFREIEELITELNVTPAEIAEELMISDEADIALDGLIKFLYKKKQLVQNAVDEKEDEIEEINKQVETKEIKKRKGNSRRGGRTRRKIF